MLNDPLLITEEWHDDRRQTISETYSLPPKELTSDRLAEAIQFAYSEPAQEAAKRMGETIRAEDGASTCTLTAYGATAIAAENLPPLLPHHPPRG
jgi:hypothetical protein